MWIDNRSIEEIKTELSNQLDQIESRHVKSKAQATKEINSFLAAHKGSKSWTDYNEAKKIIGWSFDKEEYELMISVILTELGL